MVLWIVAVVFFVGGAYGLVTGVNIVFSARDGLEAAMAWQLASTPLIVGALLLIGAVLIAAIDAAATRIVAEIQRGAMHTSAALRQQPPPPPPPPAQTQQHQPTPPPPDWVRVQ
jgi:hypothetical protein